MTPEPDDDAADLAEALDAVIHRYQGEGIVHAAAARSPLEELIAKEDAGAGNADWEWQVRCETFNRLLAWFYADGRHPLQVLRRVYGVTKALAPQLLGDMPLDDLALLCGDGGKATVSARIRRIYNHLLEKSGQRNVQAFFQKNARTLAKYSLAQRGNRNRARDKRRPKR